jgi:hypothetical protein
LLKWVVADGDVPKIEKRLGRAAVDSHRTKLYGKDLAWKQIGVLGRLVDNHFHSLLNGFHLITH